MDLLSFLRERPGDLHGVQQSSDALHHQPVHSQPGPLRRCHRHVLHTLPVPGEVVGPCTACAVKKKLAVLLCLFYCVLVCLCLKQVSVFFGGGRGGLLFLGGYAARCTKRARNMFCLTYYLKLFFKPETPDRFRCSVYVSLERTKKKKKQSRESYAPKVLMLYDSLRMSLEGG